MRMPLELERRSRMPVPVDELFRWHARPGAFERLNPPWAPARIMERTGGIETGARVRLQVGAGPIRLSWTLEHRDYQEGRQFRDVQVRGPFASWEHLHRMDPSGDSSTLTDHIRWQLPLGALGALLAGGAIRRRLHRLFDYRHRVTREDLAAHRRWARHERLDILVTGSSGLVGTALIPYLTTAGHQVRRLVRHHADAQRGDRVWNPLSGELDAAAWDGVDAVIHLAGESITSGRWTAAKRARIHESRVRGTRRLAESLARSPRPPRVLVSASAVGIYGDRGGEPADETAAGGDGFLAAVCRAWEAACAPARDRGVRVVHLRLGMVLTPAGGLLGRLLPAFRAALGGRLGSGRQRLSWVAVDDVLGALEQILHDDRLSGPLNVVAPAAVSNAEFTGTLGRVLRRPAFLSLPAPLTRLAFGAMAEEMLLAGVEAVPARLLAAGYRFRHPTLEDALRHVLGRTPPQREVDPTAG